MSSPQPLMFPELILMQEYGGDFSNYFNAVYLIFDADFIKSQPRFEGLRVSAQKLPLVDDIHRTFYHITHEGEDESDRKPDIRRMERIRFPKYLINSCPHEHILIWKNMRGRDTRVLIFNEDEGFLTVLTERKGFYLFWTAYYLTKSHSINKLKREYEEYKKAKTA